MRISVLGCGRWGSFIAWYLERMGHEIMLYGRENSANLIKLASSRQNGLLTLGAGIKLTTSLEEALFAEILVISIGAQNLRQLMAEIAALSPSLERLVLCMKGLEIGTGKRLSQIAGEYLNKARIAVWLGPGHVQEFLSGTPNCMVIDSEDYSLKEELIGTFSSDLIRFYYGRDIIGNEVGAAAKNVIGVAAGILDGLGLHTLKGALTSRGTHEISRLILAMGGNALSAYGLCHLGDYGATVFSPFSHNRRFGEAFAMGEQYSKLAEGAYTVKALMTLSSQYNVELPICSAVNDALYNGVDSSEAIERLFARHLKSEF